MRFRNIDKKNIILVKSEVYGEPSKPQKVEPIIRQFNDIFPFLQDLYHPDMNKSKFII